MNSAIATSWSTYRKGLPSGRQDIETCHATRKPVECMRRPMLNNSAPGDAIYEPFLGSGTSLIAAQSCGRVCLGIEINPLFIDVAIRRWQAFTGDHAMLEGDGCSFDFTAFERGVTPADAP